MTARHFLNLEGETIWYADDCDWSPSPEANEPAPPQSEWYAYSHIPQPSLPRKFLSDGWAEVPLGTCALMVSSSGGSGHLIHGKPGGDHDAWFRVVADSDRSIAVEFGDDVWHLVGAEKRMTDHFEVWTGQRRAYDSTCNALETPLRQWFVSVADGSVRQTFGPNGKAPTVRLLPSDMSRRRLTISFEERPEMFTLVYSDSDDGKSQKGSSVPADCASRKGERLGR